MRIRPATPEDARKLSELISCLSQPFLLKPDGAGAEAFLHSITESAIFSNLNAIEFAYLVAESDAGLLGLIAIKSHTHLFHLFVTPTAQGKGIARTLWQAASRQAMGSGNPGRFTVNSSINAIPVYQRFGFVACGPIQRRHGIAYQPMSLDNAVM